MKYDYKKQHQIGDIIYPHYNGTAGFFAKNIWSVVVAISSEKTWKHITHWESEETARLHSMILKHTKDNKNEN